MEVGETHSHNNFTISKYLYSFKKKKKGGDSVHMWRKYFLIFQIKSHHYRYIASQKVRRLKDYNTKTGPIIDKFPFVFFFALDTCWQGLFVYLLFLLYIFINPPPYSDSDWDLRLHVSFSPSPGTFSQTPKQVLHFSLLLPYLKLDQACQANYNLDKIVAKN